MVRIPYGLGAPGSCQKLLRIRFIVGHFCTAIWTVIDELCRMRIIFLVALGTFTMRYAFRTTFKSPFFSPPYPMPLPFLFKCGYCHIKRCMVFVIKRTILKPLYRFTICHILYPFLISLYQRICYDKRLSYCGFVSLLTLICKSFLPSIQFTAFLSLKQQQECLLFSDIITRLLRQLSHLLISASLSFHSACQCLLIISRHHFKPSSNS